MKNLDNIIKILESRSDIDDYSVLARDKYSFEMFFVLGKLETVRKAVSGSTQIDVFVDHDGKRGSCSITVDGGAQDDELTKKICDAQKRAKLVFDEPYSLPCDEEKVDGIIPSNLCDMDEKDIAAKVANAAHKACVEEGVGINALEVFVLTTISEVRNSNGVKKRQTKHTVELEAIPTCDLGEVSVELYEGYTLGELDEEAITKEISARLGDVKARAQAKTPNVKIDCPVILGANDLLAMFEPIALDADYSQIYLGTCLHKEGEAWQSAQEGDKLNITMRGVMAASPSSALFDSRGSALKDTQIVKDGKVVSGFGTKRYADYLKKPATGALPCIDVECGTTSYEDMLKEPHLECVYLSGLQVDLYNDYIGSEIRLAYYFDGEKRTPVTGITMSGKLSEILNTITLSNEQTVVNRYRGPHKAKFGNFNIF